MECYIQRHENAIEANYTLDSYRRAIERENTKIIKRWAI